MAQIRVDISDLKELEVNVKAMGSRMINRLAVRVEKHLRDEIPVRSGNLKKGVSSVVKGLNAQITVSSTNPARGPRNATLVSPSGKTKSITLRGTKDYNYAEVVALGNKDAVVRAKEGKIFLIPVKSAPSDEAYIQAGSQIYVTRRSRKGKPANPFHQRAADKLISEAPAMLTAIVEEFR